jgi:hypothetical protein
VETKNEKLLLEVDEFAIAWIKARQLEGLLGGPVGNEFGGNNCQYTNRKHNLSIKNIVKLLEKEKIDFNKLKSAL